jgi:hypothetical protein
MTTSVTIRNFHKKLAQQAVAPKPNEIDAFCLMLLHACHIALSDAGHSATKVRGFVAITTRHAGEVVASLFDAPPENHYFHWYYKWNGDWRAYAVLESPPNELLPRLALMRQAIESHPWVERLSDEDWSLIELLDRA